MNQNNEGIESKKLYTVNGIIKLNVSVDIWANSQEEAIRVANDRQYGLTESEINDNGYTEYVCDTKEMTIGRVDITYKKAKLLHIKKGKK